MLPDDLPKELPTFIARFGADKQCHPQHRLPSVSFISH
jgi:hypothetical protein